MSAALDHFVREIRGTCVARDGDRSGDIDGDRGLPLDCPLDWVSDSPTSSRSPSRERVRPDDNRTPQRKGNPRATLDRLAGPCEVRGFSPEE